jgi:hypothetical protein
MTGTTAYGSPTTALPGIMNGVVCTPAPMGQLHQQYAVEVQHQRHYAGLGLTPLVSQPFQQHAVEPSMVPVDQYRLGLQRQYNPDASHYDSHPSSSLLPIDLIEGSTGQRRTPTNAADRGVVPRLLNTTWYWGFLRCHRSMPFLWHIRPTAAAEGVRHSTVDPSIAGSIFRREPHSQGLYLTTETDAGLSTADVLRSASRGKPRRLLFGRAMWTCWCKGRGRRNCRKYRNWKSWAENALSGLRTCLIRISHICIHSGRQILHDNDSLNIDPLDAGPVDNTGNIPLAAPIPNPLYQGSSVAI